MARSLRLFDLIQALRRRRGAATASTLADEMGVSKRTIYRDIETLIALGAPIVGEAGVGFVLRPGFLLPPLMMTEEELEALALGGLWVTQRADPALALAASNALVKISAVLPQPLAVNLENPPLVSGSAPAPAPDGLDLALLRRTIRREHKIRFTYRDDAGATTERIAWPVAIVYFDASRLIAAWCEARQAFRHFRTDRILDFSVLEERYPSRRHALFKAWRKADADWRSRVAARNAVAGN